MDKAPGMIGSPCDVDNTAGMSTVLDFNQDSESRFRID